MEAKRPKLNNTFHNLENVSVIVCDSGEVDLIKQFHPKDATTNPSLIYKAASNPIYNHLIDNAIQSIKLLNISNKNEELEYIMDKLSVNFGCEIAKIVPGYISTEIDARLSFNTNETVKRAKRIIQLYSEMGIEKDRILIKIAATYEGIRAGEILENEGIHCNLTLVFSLIQAAACANANITLISPFVGRIMDWFKAKAGGTITYTRENDPGIQSVKKIFYYFKKFQYKTIVMGASFRNLDEILGLAGCDRLTIAPQFLDELTKSNDEVPLALDSSKANELCTLSEKIDTNEINFRWLLNEDAMATEKLAEGIRLFSIDLMKLEDIIKAKL